MEAIISCRRRNALEELKYIMTNESEIMQEKIVQAEELQVIMKGCNKIIRSKKLSDDGKRVQIIEKYQLTDTEIMELLTPNYVGDIGYAPWRLTNNTANIRRMKRRVIALQKKESTATSQIEFVGGMIIDNAEDDRVQIDFNAKPDETMCAALRGSGWRWAPSVQLWQRARTPNAIESAKYIVGA